MKIQVVNPLYDIVFKNLVEDERLARILLSTLLKKKVVDVKTRKHEYTNTTHNSISMFFIGFIVQVLEENGETISLFIKLQKTWVDADVLRLRQYVSVHYINPENIVKEDEDQRNAIPMIDIYMLNHRVGDITEPVIYVRHKAYNFDDVEVKEGMPDAFVESLVHDSIIVQLPLLNRRMNNRLEKVFSLFDQSRCSASTRQIIDIDENDYVGDDDMMYLINRLCFASANVEMREQMNLEDECYSAIEERDTQLMNQAQLLAEKDTQIAVKDDMLHNFALLLKNKGMSVEEIAEQTGNSVAEIQRVLGEH